MGTEHLGPVKPTYQRIAELEAENKRILGSHDAYAAKYEDELQDRKAAEALVADLENQIAEGLAGLDQAEGRIAELEGALEKAAVLDAGRPLPRDGSEREYMNGVSEGLDRAKAYVRKIAEQALAGDGSTVVDVVQAARELKARGLANCGPLLECKALFEAVDKMDGKETQDG